MKNWADVHTLLGQHGERSTLIALFIPQVGQLCDVGHLDDQHEGTGDSVLHCLMQLLCPIKQFDESWPGLQLWLLYAEITFYLLERGVDRSVENWRQQSASDLMDVAAVHRCLIDARERAAARSKICFLAGLLQVRTPYTLMITNCQCECRS